MGNRGVAVLAADPAASTAASRPGAVIVGDSTMTNLRSAAVIQHYPTTAIIAYVMVQQTLFHLQRRRVVGINSPALVRVISFTVGNTAVPHG